MELYKQDQNKFPKVISGVNTEGITGELITNDEVLIRAFTRIHKNEFYCYKFVQSGLLNTKIQSNDDIKGICL